MPFSCLAIDRLLYACVCLSLIAVSGNAAEVAISTDLGKVETNVRWFQATDIGLEGKAWAETKSPYQRFPDKAEAVVRPPVWNLSQHSAGIAVRFSTNSSTLSARWTLTSARLAMPHMAATGVSGLDLYIKTVTGWRWVITPKPSAQSNTAVLARNLPTGKHEFLLYLPLYNGVSSVEVGVDPGAQIWSNRYTGEAAKPLVFWGTSITQGACASRPGMVHTAILGRRLDRPVVNLGFSGNGRMEPEVARLLAEIDAAIYIIDCCPNLKGEEVAARTEPLVAILREKRPDTPILLVEDRNYADAFLVTSKRARNDGNQAALRAAYQRLTTKGTKHLHYLEGDRLLGRDGEDTVDGSHPTDLGFVRHADTFEAALLPILGGSRGFKWYKGNLHTHTLWSDGNDFPEMVADWYRRHGYHFLALSDHNILSEGMKWMNIKAIESRGGTTALAKYLARFGDRWVETRGSREQGNLEIRLKPLSEVRPLVEKRGEFLMIPAEEITDQGVHINATNIGRLIPPQRGKTVRETIQNNLRAVAAQAEELGRVIIPHLNHPNLGDKGISAEDLAALVQDEFFEIHNGVEGDGDLGSDKRHSLETLWDITSTLRLTQFKAPPLYGLATDDSHHYHGKSKASPGRGWIMLRARQLTPESIVTAMQRGDFYASNGVELLQVDFDTKTGTLHIEIKPSGTARFTTEFIGTPVEFDATSKPRINKKTKKKIPGTRNYSADVGKVFKSVQGLTATYQLTGKELYVRARITSDQAPANPTTESPRSQAWTQPVGWQKHLE
ncbi:MAG: SGNH/GDSL hydrolase family protein [Pirellulaceae bacterium]